MIYDQVRDLTMVSRFGIEFTVLSAVDAIRDGIVGDMVECGTWKGGAGIAMLLAQRQAFGYVQRKVHFFDSFKGLPKVVPELDGPAAVKWQAETSHNCKASRKDLEKALAKFGFRADDFQIWDGWFDQTFTKYLAETRNIALLRIDCDWYGPVKLCLQTLVPLVSKGATIIVDDYYAWDGCTRATNEFMASSGQPYMLKSILEFSGAYFERL